MKSLLPLLRAAAFLRDQLSLASASAQVPAAQMQKAVDDHKAANKQ